MKTLYEVVQLHAEQRGHLVLYRELDSRGQEQAAITFAEFHHRAQAAARYLLAQEEVGQTVLLLYPPGIDFMVAFVGTILAGKIAVPTARPGAVGLNRTLPRLRRVAENCSARTILADAELLVALHRPEAQQWLPRQDFRCLALPAMADCGDSALAPPGLDNIAYLQYSSGSTGEPKGVMITHRNMAANTAVIDRQMGSPGRVVSVEWMPHFHDYSLVSGLLLALYSGGEHVILPSMTLLRAPFVWLQVVGKYKAWRSGGPNFSYQQCVDRITDAEVASLDLSQWAWAHCGAEPIKAETIKAFLQRFGAAGLSPQAFHPAYGMAETTLCITSTRKGDPWRPMPVRPGDKQCLTASCGVPGAGMELRIVDPVERRIVPEGQVGEIWVSTACPSVSPGYWQDDVRNQEIFQATLTSGPGRFLRTGDLGYVDAGELIVSGRLKDLIIVQGRNIVPTDIEWLAQMGRPGLRKDCGAAFATDEALSDHLVLVQEADKHCPLEDLPAYAQQIQEDLALQLGLTVDEIVFIRSGSLPKTSSGKIQRRECCSLWLQGLLPVIYHHSHGVGAVTAPDVEQVRPLDYLVRMMAEQLACHPHAIDPHRSFSDLGLDSPALVHFHEVLHRKRPKWTVEITDLFHCASLAGLAERIEVLTGTSEPVAGGQPQVSTRPRSRRRIPDLHEIQLR
jgi:acyl-CoA synthetase (AMP-forming)/AMP-acid ligase II